MFDAIYSYLVLVAWLAIPALVAALTVDAIENRKHHRDVIARSQEARRVHTR